LGLATYFLINQKDYLVPMAIEEPSVVAAASCSAKLARKSGGFSASSTDPLMIGQIQFLNIKNIKKACHQIEIHKQDLLKLANDSDVTLASLGGGAVDLKPRVVSTCRGQMLVVHLIVNVKDAMGANIVNTMAENISPEIEKIVQGNVCLRIVSNLPIYRMAKARAVWKKEVVSELVVERVLDAHALAKADPFRASTHNKGIMNGIDAVALATGNDFRALEAGVHAYAAFKNDYGPVTRYEKNEDGDLVGEIELPLAVGVVGGVTRSNPMARLCLKILGVKTSAELSRVFACVGLAQNFAALRVLVKEGIQSSHMKLHSKNLAIVAGASNRVVDLVAEKMIEESNISFIRAKELAKIYEKK
jgi:hydroxymethylglutaryl-CoA reductase